MVSLQTRIYKYEKSSLATSASLSDFRISKKTNKKVSSSSKPQPSQSDYISTFLRRSITLKNHLKNIFESHGAVQFSPSLMQLKTSPAVTLIDGYSKLNKSELADTNDTAADSDVKSKYLHNGNATTRAEFLDHSGQVVVLPSDLISPYSRYVSLMDIKSSTRYQFDRVYTQSFDIFTPSER